MLKITFLGTGTSNGVPIIGCECDVCNSKDPNDKRLRSSCLVENEGDSILIDCGPDFRQQALRERIKTTDAILLTHSHRDHIAGLDDARLFAYYTKKPIKIICDKLTLNDLKKVYFYYFKKEKYPGVVDWDINIHEFKDFYVNKTNVIPIVANHGELKISAYRIGNFAWLTDVKSLPTDSFDKLKGLKHLALDCLREKQHHSHLTISEAVDLAKQIGAETTWLIHMNHEFGLHKEMEKSLPENVRVAYDGLKLSID